MSRHSTYPWSHRIVSLTFSVCNDSGFNLQLHTHPSLRKAHQTKPITTAAPQFGQIPRSMKLSMTPAGVSGYSFNWTS